MRIKNERLDEILSASSGLEKLMGDILRVLTIFTGALWLWEIYQELKGFRFTLGEEPPTLGDVTRAINKLSNEGFILTEKRIRASLGGEGIEDVLITLNLSPRERIKLLMDKRVREYQSVRQRVFKLARE